MRTYFIPFTATLMACYFIFSIVSFFKCYIKSANKKINWVELVNAISLMILAAFYLLCLSYLIINPNFLKDGF